MATAPSTSILQGANPLDDHTALFLLQLLIIIVLCRLIAVPLGYLRQPRVIAEVIAGIILGKSALSKIPAFKNTIFPDESLVRLRVIAEFGLILFLFLVGMEIDPRKMFKNLKQSAAISAAGILLPFALGVGVSKALYDNLMVTDTTLAVLPPFSSFLIFTGVAMSITAFPVLARILAEQKLLQTEVGIITLSAAALDDALAWCLLVLVVAIIHNTGNYAVAFYVFCVTVGYALFLYFGVRPVLAKIVQLRSDSDNISQFSVFLVFCLVCLSSWFTSAIGVHSMFGGFLAGVIIPHEYGFAIKLTEKIEDLVTILFLPLYFTLSGLNTRIDALNDGISWAMIALTIACAIGGKVGGCTLAARASGLKWRESWTVGFLMSTKGLVEIIVLNLGLNAGVISERVFTVMIVMALVTTFITVPIVSVLYPMRLYINVASNQTQQLLISPDELRKGNTDLSNPTALESESELRLMICLKSIQNVPSMMSLVQMIQSTPIDMTLFALRLISLGERSSTIMMASDTDVTIRGDSVLNVFKTFGEMSRIGFKPLLAVSHYEDFAENILTNANSTNCNIVIIPWIQHSEKSAFGINQYYDEQHRAHLIDHLYANATCTIVMFIDRGLTIKSPEYSEANECTTQSKRTEMMSHIDESPQIVWIPFKGGRDCREALIFGMYFTHFKGVQVKVLRVPKSAENTSTHTLGESSEDEKLLTLMRTRPNVACQVVQGRLDAADFLGGKGLKKTDIVVLGSSMYEQPGMKDYIDRTCLSSVCIVHRNAVKQEYV